MNSIHSAKGHDLWQIEKIGVIGPGIVGMPMAALLANARIKTVNNHPAKVVVVQRNSINSGWKVDAINHGQSVIGGIEPGLNKIVSETVAEGILSATHNIEDIHDADVILVAVQTDKKGFGPDYGPMFEALTGLAQALQKKPKDKKTLIIFESTLAPSSMSTVIKEHFAKYGLIEGKDILLGNSPNRVMPGRLVERVAQSDKLAGGLHPETSKMIYSLYSNVVTEAIVHKTNSLTAEIVKTLENAYRDVRIAFSTEIVRYCDKHNIDFYQVREKVNLLAGQNDSASFNPNAVPSGALLIPTIGVGGHCLPKDGILLWWRKIESGADTAHSLILNSRIINNASPAKAINLAEENFGDISGKKIALLGTAYRFNSEDTRNSPTLVLANQLLEKNCSVILHDPYVKSTDQNLLRFNMDQYFTRDMEKSLKEAEYAFICTAHKVYAEGIDYILQSAPNLKGLFDGCNIYSKKDFENRGVKYAGIGKGEISPSNAFIEFVYQCFRIVEKGLANEVLSMIEFLNKNYANGEFNKADFKEVQRLAGSCVTGCLIAEPGKIHHIKDYKGYMPKLVSCSFKS